MELDCIDYTGMNFEGFKLQNSPGSNVTIRPLWANDSSYYDEMGNLLSEDAPLVSVNFDYLPGSDRFAFTAS